MILPTLLILLCVSILTTAQKDLVYACESLICDPPKMCILQDQVAQCLLVLAPTPRNRFDAGPTHITTATPVLLPGTEQPPTSLFAGFPPALPPALPPAPTTEPPTTTTTLSLASLLGVLNIGSPSITLPPLFPAPSTSTTTPAPAVDICSLPPLTGNCRHARIMWYYDTETGMCERFSFSGCGNLNRFSSKMQCEMTCIRRG